MVLPEEVPADTVIVPWQKVQRVNLNWQYIRNAYVTGDSLFLYGQENFMIYRPQSDALTAFFSPYWSASVTNPVLSMNPAMRSSFIIDWYESGMGIRTTRSPVSGQTSKFINLEAVDSTLQCPWWIVPGMSFELPCVSENNNVFAPMYSDSGYPAAFMFEARVNYLWSDYYADTAHFRRVDFIAPGFEGMNLGGVWSFNDKFFVNVGSYFSQNHYTVCVEPDGTWTFTGIPDPCQFYDIVQTNDSLIAICGITPSIYISTDGGSVWTPRFYVPGSWLGLDYFVLDGGTYAFSNDMIYRMTISQNDVRLTELNNLGLEGNLITDVVNFEESVYVTTLSGLFVKPLSSFNAEHP